MVNTPKPVIQVSATELRAGGGTRMLMGGQALRVICVTGQGLAGGAAIPVYALADTDLRESGGDFRILDNTPILVTVIASGRDQRGGAVIPVYPVDVNGTYDASCFGEERCDALLLESGDYLLLEDGFRICLE